jgi:cytochrome P450 / NADPH-cytochrome P450 reductase
MSQEIPGPKALPIIGNLLDLQDEVPLHALERLVDVYGSIIRIKTPNDLIVIGKFDLFDELCDETRFFKVASRALKSLQNQDKSEGLFTAVTEKSEDWGVAHRVLVPAFGPLAIQDMFDGSKQTPKTFKSHH